MVANILRSEKRLIPLSISPAPRVTLPLEVNGLIAADFIRDRDIYVMSQRGTVFSNRR
jgi:hypothetical protein